MLNLLPPLIVICGCIIMWKLRYTLILHPVRAFHLLRESLKERRAMSALMLSLAGTLGVGNIIGVAFGISVGGAGSVFWLFFSVIFSSVIKYAEVTIASDNTSGREGGVMYVIKNTFKKSFSWLASAYAILCVLLSLTMGSALQARSAIETLPISESPLLTLISALIFTVLCAVSIKGGGKKIEKITLVLIPLAALIYIFLTLSLIFKNIEGLPSVITSIFEGAFDFRAALGGGGGFVLSRAIREGFCRGMLSNEAGAGTSTIAHARNDKASPSAAGLLGIIEVFIDTAVLCPLTALATLLSVPAHQLTGSGAEIINAAVSSLGSFSMPLLSFSVISFAFSTVICWYYYGKSSLIFLGKTRHGWYPILYLSSVFIGSLTSSSFIISVSDYILFFLTLISLFATMKNLERIKELSRF